jgi:FHA domain-containing protein
MSDRASGSLVDFTLDGRSNPQDALRGGTPSLVDPLQAVDPMKLFGGAEDRLLADAPGEPAAGALPMRDDMPELGAFFAPPRSIEDPALPHQAAGAAGRPAPVSPTARTAHAPPQRGEPPATPIPTRPTVAPPAPPTPAPEVRGPRPTSPAPVPADRAAGAAPIGSAGQDALIAAFLEGAHAANVPIPGGLTPALMRQLGALVFQAVAGAMALIAARQITKREIGAEMTMIVASGNNPLKFLPTAEAAITQMIGPHMPGFMTPEAAMRNAFEDLSAHEIGVIAGTRAAFAEVLRRFDPEQLEERLGKGGMLDAVLPVARRGKLWSLYQERFHQIRSEAQDDFDSLFGEAFTKAYEDEVARQRSQRSPG